MWLWPLHRFWSFTPWGWALALVWNCCEMTGVSMPLAHLAFGVIIGHKGKRVA